MINELVHEYDYMINQIDMVFKKCDALKETESYRDLYIRTDINLLFIQNRLKRLKKKLKDK